MTNLVGSQLRRRLSFSTLESLAGKCIWLQSEVLEDCLLMELVPHLNADAEEIRGLFAPPPWGDDVPPSAFFMTNVGEWDKFRNTDDG
ncbi:hypothetical protein V6N12_058977 [Hibiscus sabdariffa]|uniref:R3H-associated N-terminal domain-containing protein n=1 Tax=Hibiscus sabdariffa TaxID=183260 RepID=A0ABR2EVP5_9ROSI